MPARWKHPLTLRYTVDASTSSTSGGRSLVDTSVPLATIASLAIGGLLLHFGLSPNQPVSMGGKLGKAHVGTPPS